MAESRIGEQWNHTAALLSLLHNANRDPKRGKPSSPEDWHPYAKTVNRHKPTPEAFEMLKAVFVNGRDVQHRRSQG